MRKNCRLKEKEIQKGGLKRKKVKGGSLKRGRKDGGKEGDRRLASMIPYI